MRLSRLIALLAWVTSSQGQEFHVSVVADTGHQFTRLGRGPSINDSGHVAFQARGYFGPRVGDEYENLFGVKKTGIYRLLAPVLLRPLAGTNATQSFGDFVQVNNEGRVAAVRRLHATVRAWTSGGIFLPFPMFGPEQPVNLSYAESYPISGLAEARDGEIVPTHQFAMSGLAFGGLPIRSFTLWTNANFANRISLDGFYFWNPFWADRWASPYDATQPFITIYDNISQNNAGQAIFGSAIMGERVLANHERQLFPYYTQDRMLLADTGEFVYRSSDHIYVGLSTKAGTALLTSDFVHVSPVGISDDGKVVAFSALLREDGAARINSAQREAPPVAPGGGVFALVRGAKPVVVRIAGMTSNGQLDPGERWNDQNADGKVGPGEDLGVIHGFNSASRVCVNHFTGPSSVDFNVAYVAIGPNGAPVLMASRLNLGGSVPEVGAPNWVYTATDQIHLHDGVNNYGEMCFWARTGGREYIMRASGKAPPMEVINVLTHGFGNESILKDFPPLSPTSGFVTFHEDFFKDWYALSNALIAQAESKGLAGSSKVYLARWSSIEGFLETAICTALSLAYRSPSASHPGFLVAAVAERLAETFARRSKSEAAIAAQMIVSDLVGNGYLGPPSASRSGQQLIHLIGHSRGAAVNARVAELLTLRGYAIDQYTALDGYDVQWPPPGNAMGDLNIVEVLRYANVRRKLNFIADQGGVGAPIWVEAAKRALSMIADPLSISVFDSALEFLKDVRAPQREAGGFVKDVVIPDSDHMNIIRLYYENPAFLDNSHIGQLGAEPAALPQSRVLGRMTKSSLPANSTDRLVDFADGNFETLSSSSLGLRSAAETMEPGWREASLWLARDDLLMSTLWRARGEVSLYRTPTNAMAQLRQATNASIGQIVCLEPGTRKVQFQVEVPFASHGAQLLVSFKDQLIAAYALTNGMSASFEAEIPKSFSGCELLSFSIVSGDNDGTTVRLDDLKVHYPPSPPFSDDWLGVPSQVSQVGTFPVIVGSIASHGTRVFAATDGNSVLGYETAPSGSPVLLEETSFRAPTEAMQVHGGYLYALNAYALEAAPLTNLQQHIMVTEYPRDFAFAGDRCYVLMSWPRIEVWDVKKPTAPRKVTTYYGLEDFVQEGLYSAGNSFQQIAVASNFVYLCGFPQIIVFDFGDPYLPMPGARIPVFQGGPICVDGNSLFLADGREGLKVFSLSNPMSPQLAAVYPTWPDPSVAGWIATSLEVRDGLAMISGWKGVVPALANFFQHLGSLLSGVDDDLTPPVGLHLIDVLHPSEPRLISVIDSLGALPRGFRFGEDLFVADGAEGFRIFDLRARPRIAIERWDRQLNVSWSPAGVNDVLEVSDEIEPWQWKSVRLRTVGSHVTPIEGKRRLFRVRRP